MCHKQWCHQYKYIQSQVRYDIKVKIQSFLNQIQLDACQKIRFLVCLFNIFSTLYKFQRFKSQKSGKKSEIYNHFHNILRLFDVLTNFPFTTSETMRDYYLQTWYIRIASQIAAAGGAYVPTQEKKKKS